MKIKVVPEHADQIWNAAVIVGSTALISTVLSCGGNKVASSQTCPEVVTRMRGGRYASILSERILIPLVFAMTSGRLIVSVTIAALSGKSVNSDVLSSIEISPSL